MYKIIFTRILRILAIAVFTAMITVSVSAQTETILHSFTNGSDGGNPQGGFIFDGKGNLYGTTGSGGGTSACSGCGTAFELVPGSNGTWTENVIFDFGTSFSDANDPFGPLTFDSKGNLYGTTDGGGTGFLGTVFELTPGSNGVWTEKVLYNFTGGVDGGFPYGSGLALDSAGNLYGLTESGGAYGFGTVFEVVAGANGTWTEKVLHSFTGGSDGNFPFGTTPIFDAAGNLYANASGGGFHDYGVVFELIPGSNGHWSEKVLYSFSGGAGGSFPGGKLLFDSTGNLYGTTTYTVYELSPGSNGTWTEKTLHSFVGGPDGATPYAGLVFDKAGNLYGTTNSGGNHRGTVYELIPGSSGTWTEKILHRFTTTGGDGIFPTFATLIVDANGNVYGTTPQGGSSGAGVVFEIAP
jgi:uncharacterized repeat protein (TIGR03803 family)